MSVTPSEQQHDWQRGGGFHEGLAARFSSHLRDETARELASCLPEQRLINPRFNRLRNRALELL